MAPKSAIPAFYYFTFSVFEPLVTILPSLGAMLYPKQAYENQAPWPAGQAPPTTVPLASMVTIYQLAYVCILVETISILIIRVCARHLEHALDLQEKVLGALLTALMIGDVGHTGITLWALGDNRWNASKWSALTWVTILGGFVLFIPRLMWHLGIWRYVDKRDGLARKQRTD